MPQAPAEPLLLRERLRARAGRVWVVGHRGAMGYCPENTLASFERARALGADWIELDVHLTRDGQLAVIHDETVDRTTDGHGLVGEHTLADLKRLDAGAWFGPEFRGERIPSLDEVLAWARANQVLVDIEIKNAPVYYDGIEAAVVAAVDRFGMRDRVMVISFDHRAVQRLGQLAADVLIGILYSARPVDSGVGLARAAGAHVVLPDWQFVTESDLQGAHAAGLLVAPWASSDAAVLRRLVGWGADAITSDHPDILRAVQEETAVHA